MQELSRYNQEMADARFARALQYGDQIPDLAIGGGGGDGARQAPPVPLRVRFVCARARALNSTLTTRSRSLW